MDQEPLCLNPSEGGESTGDTSPQASSTTTSDSTTPTTPTPPRLTPNPMLLDSSTAVSTPTTSSPPPPLTPAPSISTTHGTKATAAAAVASPHILVPAPPKLTSTVTPALRTYSRPILPSPGASKPPPTTQTSPLLPPPATSSTSSPHAIASMASPVVSPPHTHSCCTTMSSKTSTSLTNGNTRPVSTATSTPITPFHTPASPPGRQVSQSHPAGSPSLVRTNQSPSPVRQRVSQQTLLLGKGLKGSGQDQVLLRAQMLILTSAMRPASSPSSSSSSSSSSSLSSNPASAQLHSLTLRPPLPPGTLTLPPTLRLKPPTSLPPPLTRPNAPLFPPLRPRPQPSATVTESLTAPNRHLSVPPPTLYSPVRAVPLRPRLHSPNGHRAASPRQTSALQPIAAALSGQATPIGRPLAGLKNCPLSQTVHGAGQSQHSALTVTTPSSHFDRPPSAARQLQIIALSSGQRQTQPGAYAHATVQSPPPIPTLPPSPVATESSDISRQTKRTLSVDDVLPLPLNASLPKKTSPLHSPLPLLSLATPPEHQNIPRSQRGGDARESEEQRGRAARQGAREDGSVAKDLRLERDDPRLQRDDPRLERDDPRLQRDDPRLERDNPRLQRDDPRLERDDPRLQRDDPRLERDDPRLQRDDPRLERDDPRLQRDDPRLKRDDPRLQRDDPRQERDDPRLQRDDPRLQRDNPRQERDDPRLQRDDPRLQRDDPRLERDDPRLQRDDPKLQRDDPRLERDDPRLERDDMRLQRDDPRLQRDDPRLQRDDPRLQRDDQRDKVKDERQWRAEEEEQMEVTEASQAQSETGGGGEEKIKEEEAESVMDQSETTTTVQDLHQHHNMDPVPTVKDCNTEHKPIQSSVPVPAPVQPSVPIQISAPVQTSVPVQNSIIVQTSVPIQTSVPSVTVQSPRLLECHRELPPVGQEDFCENMSIQSDNQSALSSLSSQSPPSSPVITPSVEHTPPLCPAQPAHLTNHGQSQHEPEEVDTVVEEEESRRLTEPELLSQSEDESESFGQLLSSNWEPKAWPEGREVLTHLVEGFVIQEGLQPFPVNRSSLLVPEQVTSPQEVNGTNGRAELPVTDAIKPAEPSSDSDEEDGGDTDDPSTRSGHRDRTVLHCQFCGKRGHAHNFMRSKRFCSTSCARGFNVRLTKRLRALSAGSRSERPRPTLNRAESVPGKPLLLRLPRDLWSAGRREKEGKEKVAMPEEEEDEDMEGGGEEEDDDDRGGGDEDLSLAVAARMERRPPHRARRASAPAMTTSTTFKPAPSQWSVEDVTAFIHTLPGCSDVAEAFRLQEIDGQALLLLTEDHLMTSMNIKLGPALKICAHINALKNQ
ncbi:TRIO and F-actin-binding protein isoform X2 [Solea solea]|uniref:TRIO and F-actin-binding protein isoform X2 n=1 Tax=Solea solea TaxID=90069 RepID=UPI00272C3E44|nr:TRIO and F-actin-binding protein isoform X2 [Solea solea]